MPSNLEHLIPQNGITPLNFAEGKLGHAVGKAIKHGIEDAAHGSSEVLKGKAKTARKQAVERIAEKKNNAAMAAQAAEDKAKSIEDKRAGLKDRAAQQAVNQKAAEAKRRQLATDQSAAARMGNDVRRQANKEQARGLNGQGRPISAPEGAPKGSAGQRVYQPQGEPANPVRRNRGVSKPGGKPTQFNPDIPTGTPPNRAVRPAAPAAPAGEMAAPSQAVKAMRRRRPKGTTKVSFIEPGNSLGVKPL